MNFRYGPVDPICPAENLFAPSALPLVIHGEIHIGEASYHKIEIVNASEPQINTFLEYPPGSETWVPEFQHGILLRIVFFDRNYRNFIN